MSFIGACMTLLKKFNETGQEIGSEDVEINESNFQRYIDQYGLERAMGYCDAVSDLFYDLEYRMPVPFTVQRNSTAALKFHAEKQKLLNYILLTLEANKNQTQPDSDQKYEL